MAKVCILFFIAIAFRTFSSHMPSHVTARNSVDESIWTNCRQRSSASAVRPQASFVGHVPHLPLTAREATPLRYNVGGDGLSVGGQGELCQFGVKAAKILAHEVHQQPGRVGGELNVVGLRRRETSPNRPNP